MKKLSAFIILLAVLLSLQPARAQEISSQTQSVSEVIKMLNGSWNWTESRHASRGVKPTVKTPASTKQNITVTFKPDNQALVYVNNKLKGTYHYEITKTGNDYPKISFSDKHGNNLAAEYLEEGPVMVSAAELTISGGYNDAGSNQKFQKITAVKKTTTTKTKTKKK